MALKNIDQALENVEMTYNQILEIAENMLKDLITPVNNVLKSIGEDINSLSMEQLKHYAWSLQYKGYQLSEVKEKSLMKASIAETLRKEQYALKFNEASGSAAVKDNIALIESSAQTVVEILYDVISSQLKTKLDQIQRCIDLIKSIMMTRMQEAKMSVLSSD